MILTLGADKKSSEELIKIFELHNVTEVWDIRDGIVTSFFDFAAGNSFSAKVHATGIKYRYMDLKLGKEVCRARQELFFQYIDDLKAAARDSVVLILGNHIDPAHCVRGLVIGREVRDNLLHILKPGITQTQDQLEMCLVEKRFPERNQCSLFEKMCPSEMVSIACHESLAKI